MPATSETIVSATTHPGDSTAETVTGDKFKGDGYYGRSDGLHTVQYNVSGVAGTIKMQGTLATIQLMQTTLILQVQHMTVQLMLKMVLLLTTLQETLYG